MVYGKSEISMNPLMNSLLLACILGQTPAIPQESTLNLQLPAAHSSSAIQAPSAEDKRLKNEFEDYVNRKGANPAVKRTTTLVPKSKRPVKRTGKESVVGRLGRVTKASTIYKSPSQDGDMSATVALDTYIAINRAEGDWYGVLMSDRSTGWIAKDDVEVLDYEVVNTKDEPAPKPQRSSAVYFDIPTGRSGDSTTRRLTRSMLRAANQYLAGAVAGAGGAHVERLGEGLYMRYGPAMFVAYSHNIIKTISLTSPYMGFVEVKRFQRCSDIGSTREAVAQLPLSDSRDEVLTVTFAYQDGRWVCKGTQ
jgi:hypothetical protein